MQLNEIRVIANCKLLKAAEKGDHKAIRGLAKCPNVDINIADFKGKTPLFVASMMNHVEAVNELLAVSNIDPNKGRTSDHKTPFSISAENGYFLVMKHLLNHRAINVNKGWEFGNWPSLKYAGFAPLRNSQFDTIGVPYDGKVIIV